MNSQQKLAQVQQLLNQCQYHMNQQVFQICQRVLHNFNFFIPQLNSVSEGFQQKTVLELQGPMQVGFQGKHYAIITIIQFPSNFPNVHPIYKIKNLNPQRFQVNPFYQGGVKPDGSVEIINNWALQTRDIIHHINMLKKTLEDNFPFYQKPQSQQQQQQQQQQQIQPQHYLNPTNAKLAIDRTIGKDLDMMLKPIEADINKIESQQNKYQQELEVLEQKECLMNMTGEHMSTQLTQVERQLETLDQFIHQYEHQVLTPQTLPLHLKEANPFTSQVIQLIAENKAIRDSYLYIDNAFKKNKVDFETTLKVISSFSAKEFMNLELLNKCNKSVEQH